MLPKSLILYTHTETRESSPHMALATHMDEQAGRQGGILAGTATNYVSRYPF